MKLLIISIFYIALSVTSVMADNCPAGQYNSSDTGCTQCPEGKWSAGGEVTGCQTCSMPNNAQGTSVGNTAADKCSWNITCNAGQYWNGTRCASCSGTGRYSDQETTYTGTGPSLAAQQCTYECVTPATTNSAGTGCQCPSNYDLDNNKCNPKTYEITLDKNCGSGWDWCTVDTTQIYEKYNTGFSNNNSGPWASTENFKIQKVPWRMFYDFNGYSTSKSSYGGRILINTEGKLNTEYVTSATYFKNKTTLYAIWGGKPYTVIYNDREDPQNCEFGKSCKVQSPITKAENEGKIFEGWICTSGCKDKIVLKTGKADSIDDFLTLEKNEKISETGGTVTIRLEAKWHVCPKGYYCPTSTSEEKCPAGATTEAEGRTQKTECIIKGGGNGTKFCDNQGCFYLPINTKIPYTESN